MSVDTVATTLVLTHELRIGWASRHRVYVRGVCSCGETGPCVRPERGDAVPVALEWHQEHLA